MAKWFAWLFLLAIATIPAPALAGRATTSSIAQGEASAPEPGDSLWAPSLVPAGAMSMVVNLRSQLAYVFRDGVRIATTAISSGKPGYRTPTGTFTVLEKQKIHHSNKYDNAPMPFMQRLSWWGLALHGGHVPGYPASHGCVRLPHSFARWLYSQPTMGMTVIITNQKLREENTALASRGNTPGDEVVRSRKTGDLHVTKYLSGRRSSDAPAALSERAGDSEADDEAGDGVDTGDAYHGPDQRQDEERYPGQYQGQDVPDRSPEIPPQDLPQPPG